MPEVWAKEKHGNFAEWRQGRKTKLKTPSLQILGGPIFGESPPFFVCLKPWGNFHLCYSEKEVSGWTADIHQAHLQLIGWIKTTDTEGSKGSGLNMTERVVVGSKPRRLPWWPAYPCGLFGSWHFKASQRGQCQGPKFTLDEERGRPKGKQGSQLPWPVLILLHLAGCVSPLPILERESCHKRWRQCSILSFE